MSLTNDEMARLIISVGKGGSGGVRLLTPIQVATYIDRWCRSGVPLATVASKLTVSESIVNRFLSLLKLSETVKALVEFNASRTALSFSAAHQISRLTEEAEQESLARASLEYGLSSKALEQVVQSIRRSGKSVAEAVEAVLVLRPVIERHHIIMGSVTNDRVSAAIRAFKTQSARDNWGANALSGLLGERANSSVRLTPDRFTISGDDSVYKKVSSLSPDYETGVNVALAGAIGDV